MNPKRQAVVTLIRPQSLRAWRDANGLDQREAAEYLEISQGYYTKLEKRLATPKAPILKRVLERTGVPLEILCRIAS